MLNKTKSISLNGESVVEGEVVARFSANLSSDGNSSSNDSVNTFIANRDLYEKNRKAVRKDMNDFRQYVFDQEDELFADAEEKTDETATE